MYLALFLSMYILSDFILFFTGYFSLFNGEKNILRIDLHFEDYKIKFTSECSPSMDILCKLTE